ncbi:MAG: pirin family protein [Alphaproteobacteria bacterium]
MIDHRPFESLGAFRIDWLNAKHHFSFGEYYDPARMGFGPLRVWNDDEIKPRSGFDPHPHRDMEIITYVREGAITHRDSLGNEGRTEAGDIQVMSAGTGIVHGEWNRDDDLTRLFQIWIMPRTSGLTPRWETRKFPRTADGVLKPMASGEAGIDGALPIDQDATLYAGTLQAGDTVSHRLGGGRGAYLVPAGGDIELNGKKVNARDGVAVSDEESIDIRALEKTEVILVDVPV